MTKRARKAKKKAPLKKDRAWFERKVAELKTELEKLPADRQEKLRQKLRQEETNNARQDKRPGWRLSAG